MSHLSFKSRQTAALYVADDLPDPDRETFELHMMNCPECVEDVETWRVLARGIAAQAAPVAAGEARPAAAAARSGDTTNAPRQPARSTPRGWQLAASVVVASALGLLGGWFLRDGRGAALDDPSLGFASLAGPTRSGNCTVVRVAAGTRVVAVRIPGALADTELVATRSDGQPLGSAGYSVRSQPDGSWLLRLPAAAVVGQEVLLASRDRAGSNAQEPVGCISAIVVP